MRSSAPIVLILFCVLLLLQTGCTAGWLSHCSHPSDSGHDPATCSQDHCRDDYPAPVIAVAASVGHAAPSALLPARIAPPVRIVDRTSPCRRSLTGATSRPAGRFPLLI